MNLLLQIDPLYQIYIGLALFIFSVMVLFFSFRREKALSDERISELQYTKTVSNKRSSLLVEETVDIWKPVFSLFPEYLNISLLAGQAGLKSQANAITTVSFLLPALGCGAVYVATRNLSMSLLCLLLVFGFFCIFLNYLKNNRMKSFEDELPQAMEILSRSLRAGHPLMSGIEMVAKEMPDPIRSEFSAVFNEQKIGIPLKNSLLDMANRIPLTDLRFFVIAVLIHRQVGGDLGEILTNISVIIRDRIKILRQVKSITAAGRMSGWVMCLVPAFIFLVMSIINPEHTNLLLHHELGQKMLYGALVLQFLGMITIRKIVNIKV